MTALPKLPELPQKRRVMLCTKCGYSRETSALESSRGAPCEKPCGYTAFVREVDYNDDEMRSYALAAYELGRAPTLEGSQDASWRELVAKYDALIGQRYEDTQGRRYVFFGLVHSDDDYYYGMNGGKEHGLQLLSCVGDIEGFGFKLIEPAAAMAKG